MTLPASSPSQIVIVDTDVFSFLFRNDPQAAPYRRHLENVYPALTFVSVAELYRGALKNGWGSRKMESLEARMGQYLKIPSDEAMALMWARIQTAMPGRTFPSNDAWIAACALTYECPLLTNNRRDFHDVPGINLISYSRPQG